MSEDIKDEECPSESFEKGDASGKCWGDGHYRCKECKHYRADFKEHGQPLIQYMHDIQSQIRITAL